MNLNEKQAEMRRRLARQKEELPAFPKPFQQEGKITMTDRERREYLDMLCDDQRDMCAACGRRMTREPNMIRTATLGHDKCEPMGCKKRDNPDNLHRAICWLCNIEQGSKPV